MKSEYSQFEQRLISITKLKSRNAFNDRQIEIVDSIISWERLNGKISKKQDELLLRVIRTAKKGPAKKKRECMYYLYAITDSREVKLGISTSVKSRLKQLSTGSSRPIEVVWTIPAGVNRYKAYKYEKKLHRLCKKYRLNGEWFQMFCLLKVYKFEINDLDSKGNLIKKISSKENERLDCELLANSPI